MGKMKCEGCYGGKDVSRNAKCFLIRLNLMILCVFNNTEKTKLMLICL